MPTENVEQFYDDVVAALRITFTQVSGESWTPPPKRPAEHAATRSAVFSPASGRWVAFNPRLRKPGPARSTASLRSPFQPSWIGFQLVDIARLGDVVLTAFRWRETADEIFVSLTSLREFAGGPYSVTVAEAIISMNLLERIGGQWYLHVPLQRIGGLTFLV